MSDAPSIDVSGVDDSYFMLDVREDDEWQAGHIDGALHIPMGHLLERVHEVPSDSHVVAVCRSGARSAQVTAYLIEQGRSVRNLDGGMQAWAAAGRPMVSESSAKPQVI